MSEKKAGQGEKVVEMIGVSVGDMVSAQQVILENVSWTVLAHEFWAVGGLHGSGKGNLLATIAGILPPVAGEYRLFGNKFGSPTDLERSAARQRLGIVFEGGRLMHDLTMAENVAMPVRYHQNLGMEEVSEQVQALLTLIGLDKLAGSFPGSMGRNWQQRAGLARALILKPEVLLLDNALAGLDPRDSWWWLELLTELSAGHPIIDGKPMTLIATADDLSPWRERATHFALLKNRQFIVLGAQQNLAGHTEPLLQELLPAFSRRN